MEKHPFAATYEQAYRHNLGKMIGGFACTTIFASALVLAGHGALGLILFVLIGFIYVIAA